MIGSYLIQKRQSLTVRLYILIYSYLFIYGSQVFAYQLLLTFIYCDGGVGGCASKVPAENLVWVATPAW
jgi:hypothetical protein